MKEIVPKSRDELKYRVEKYLRQIKGKELKEANIKVVANGYLKQESIDSQSYHSHKESHDGSHDKHNRHSRHSYCKFRPFIKDETRSYRAEVYAVEKTPQRVEKEKGKFCEYYKSKTHDTGECTILKREVADKKLNGDLT